MHRHLLRISPCRQCVCSQSLAGADACIGTAFIEEQGLADALSNGSLLMSSLDAALTRTLAVRFRLGMFDAANSTVYTTYGPERINTHAAQVCCACPRSLMGARFIDLLVMMPTGCSSHRGGSGSRSPS